MGEYDYSLDFEDRRRLFIVVCVLNSQLDRLQTVCLFCGLGLLFGGLTLIVVKVTCYIYFLQTNHNFINDETIMSEANKYEFTVTIKNVSAAVIDGW